MFNTAIDFRRAAVSAFGAVVFSAACVLGAVGPARAATPDTLNDWKMAVGSQIDAAAQTSALTTMGNAGTQALLAVSLDADGRYAGADVVRSTGNGRLDADAIQTASQIRYPALPQGFRGKPQTVTMAVAYRR